jgi:hypothetical protein
MDSFLVQVWAPADDTSSRTPLRGVVRHVATGTQTAFRNDEEVLRVLRCAIGDDHTTRRSRANDQECPIESEEDR